MTRLHALNGPDETSPQASLAGQSTVNTSLTLKRARRLAENDDYAAFARRILRAYARRVADGDIEVYGKTREEVHDKWLTLHAAAKRGPVVTRVPALAEYLTYWLAEVIKPNREPNTYSQYELFSQRYIIPGLGSKRIDRLTVRNVQVWLNKGEAQGLVWRSIDLDKAEVSLEWQVQRVGRQLIHKQHLKTDGSTDVLPLPDICLAALKLQRQAQDRMRARLEQSGGTWPRDGLVFTTRTGRAIEPRAVSRRFDLRCTKAGVRGIRVHDTRLTCGSLLAALDVHPRVAMQILRHSKIAITMEIYTMVPDKATLAALKRLSDALGSPSATPPDDAE